MVQAANFFLVLHSRRCGKQTLRKVETAVPGEKYELNDEFSLAFKSPSASLQAHISLAYVPHHLSHFLSSCD